MTIGRLDQRTVLGVLLLFACGCLWGIMPTLSKLATQVHSHPIGLSLMVNSIGAVVCLGICWLRGVLRRPTMQELRFFFTWAILYSVLNQVLVYWLSMRLDAAVVAIFTVFEGLFIFVAAAALRMEKASSMRCGGLLVGLLGAASLFASIPQGSAPTVSLLMCVGILIPLSYAAESLYIAARRPTSIDPLLAVAFVMTCSVPLLFVLAYMSDDLMPLSFPPGRTEFMAIIIMAATSLANLAFFVLIRIAGPVFAGQVSYFNAVCGVGWGAIVLGEKISWNMLLALGFVMCGLLMVRPLSNNVEGVDTHLQAAE